MKIEIEDKIKEMLAPLLEREKLELYDITLAVRNRGSLLRVYVNRANGVKVADCETVSNHLSGLLEVEDIFPGPYTLEVSSPGLTRKLTKKSHFEKSAGSYAKVSFKKGFKGGAMEVEGVLSARPDGGFRLETMEGKSVDFVFEDVSHAKLDLEPGRKY